MNETEKIGLIPCAGYGTRMHFPIAKELWPIESQYEQTRKIQPLIENVMLNMKYADCNHQVFVVRSDKPEIMKYVSMVHHHIHKSYVCQTKKDNSGKSSGLVDAIDSSYHLIKNKTVLFGMPDTLVHPSTCFEPLLELIDQGADIAMGLFKTDTPQKFGMVQYDDKVTALLVQEIIDKPQEKIKLEYMWGILVWTAPFTAFLHKHYQNYCFDFASILNRAIYEGFNVRASIIENGFYFDFASIADVIQYNKTRT